MLATYVHWFGVLFPDNVKAKDAKEKARCKSYADRKAKVANVAIGDVVLVKQRMRNKLDTPFAPKRWIVENKKVAHFG